MRGSDSSGNWEILNNLWGACAAAGEYTLALCCCIAVRPPFSVRTALHVSFLTLCLLLHKVPPGKSDPSRRHREWPE